MLIHSNPIYIEDNGNGYALEERDAICSKCYTILDRQVKYEGINNDFKFSQKEKEKWQYCPHCGKLLYD